MRLLPNYLFFLVLALSAGASSANPSMQDGVGIFEQRSDYEYHCYGYFRDFDAEFPDDSYSANGIVTADEQELDLLHWSIAYSKDEGSIQIESAHESISIDFEYDHEPHTIQLKSKSEYFGDQRFELVCSLNQIQQDFFPLGHGECTYDVFNSDRLAGELPWNSDLVLRHPNDPMDHKPWATLSRDRGDGFVSRMDSEETMHESSELRLSRAPLRINHYWREFGLAYSSAQISCEFGL